MKTRLKKGTTAKKEPHSSSTTDQKTLLVAHEVSNLEIRTASLLLDLGAIRAALSEDAESMSAGICDLLEAAEFQLEASLNCFHKIRLSSGLKVVTGR